MANILIIGGTGLIGSALAARLSKNHTVSVLSRTQPLASVEWISADLEDYTNWADLKKDFTHLIYLAQSSEFRAFPQKTQSVFHINTVQFLNALDWAQKNGVSHIIYTSTGGIYGHGNAPFRETDLLQMNNELGFYFATKLCSEILASAYSSLLNVTLLRLFFVYGAGQKEHMLIPRLIHQIKAGKPIFLQGEEGVVINPLYVEDAIDAFEQCLLLKETNLFNIGGPEVLSLKKIAETIGEILGVKPLFEWKEPLGASCVSGDYTKFSEKTTWHPKTLFADGVEKLIAAHAKI